MTRPVLSFFLCSLALAMGLGTAWVQCWNHARADELDRTKRREDLLVAGNEELEAAILARLYALEREWAQLEGTEQESGAEVPER